MPGAKPEKLVVLDFSGTLSLGAVLYGGEVNLKRELQKAGLWPVIQPQNQAGRPQRGRSPLEFFWKEIVDATWEEGSTTGIGYKQLLYERLRHIAPETHGDEALRAKVSRFADSYFRHSTVAGRWALLFRELAKRPATATLVATDHYAEATGHICHQLEALGVTAAALGSAHDGEGVLVANSADLGCHKSHRAFWQTVREELALDRLARAVLVDDFGHNEAAAGAYAGAHKVAARKEQTVALLQETFEAPLAVFPFFLPGDAGEEAPHRAYEALVQEAITFVLEQV